MGTIDIISKMVLGTTQFGMDYGIANVSGKPTKKEVFGILDLAWEKGVRRFDTAPSYRSEALLGEFILANGSQDEAKVLTKIPSLGRAPGYQKSIRTSLESSLDDLGCPIDVLFFHDPKDSKLLMNNPSFFESLLDEYPVSTLGVSVYEPHEVEKLLICGLELAFQFPLNVLDRRFEKITMPTGRRYARSVFLQGLFASTNDLRLDTPTELVNLHKEYHNRLAKHHLEPLSFAVSFMASNDCVDYFLVGVDSAKQLQDLLNLKPYELHDISILDALMDKTAEKFLDPRKWN